MDEPRSQSPPVYTILIAALFLVALVVVFDGSSGEPPPSTVAAPTTRPPQLATTWAPIVVPPIERFGVVPDGLAVAGDDVFVQMSGSLWRVDVERARTTGVQAVDIGDGWRFAPIPELRWRDGPFAPSLRCGRVRDRLHGVRACLHHREWSAALRNL